MKEHIFPDDPPRVTLDTGANEALRLSSVPSTELGRIAVKEEGPIIDLRNQVDSTNVELEVEKFKRDLDEDEETEVLMDLITDDSNQVPPALKTLIDLKYAKNSALDLNETEQEAVQLLETQRFVKSPPSFLEQTKDPGRIEPFTPYGMSKPKTEHEGLVNLNAFLTAFIESCAQEEMPARVRLGELETQARSMLDNLTFIGNQEYMEAIVGLGNLWKSYLDADPERQIAVITKVGSLPRYAWRGKKKSDEFLWEQVMDSFTDEEREIYGPRIVAEIGELTADPERARVVLLDDWTISGDQMRDIYGLIASDPAATPYIEAGSVEINLIAATAARITKGLELNPYDESAGYVPVRAYFKAHHAPEAITSGQAHITGLHSAVNYGFYKVCNEITKAISEKFEMDMNPPLLTKVYPEYRHHPIGDRVIMGNLLTQVLKSRRMPKRGGRRG